MSCQWERLRLNLVSSRPARRGTDLFTLDNVVPHRGATKINVKVSVGVLDARQAVAGDLGWGSGPVSV